MQASKSRWSEREATSVRGHPLSRRKDPAGVEPPHAGDSFHQLRMQGAHSSASVLRAPVQQRLRRPGGPNSPTWFGQVRTSRLCISLRMPCSTDFQKCLLADVQTSNACSMV